MIYLLVLLLLVPVSGWAGEPSKIVPYIYADAITGPQVECYIEPEHKVIQCPIYERLDCLATMEQAMLAVEPFVESMYSGEAGYQLRRKLFSNHDLPKQFNRAKQLWADAKRCWREP
jgi:hypothetical protein